MPFFILSAAEYDPRRRQGPWTYSQNVVDPSSCNLQLAPFQEANPRTLILLENPSLATLEGTVEMCMAAWCTKGRVTTTALQEAPCAAPGRQGGTHPHPPALGAPGRSRHAREHACVLPKRAVPVDERNALHQALSLAVHPTRPHAFFTQQKPEFLLCDKPCLVQTVFNNPYTP